MIVLLMTSKMTLILVRFRAHRALEILLVRWTGMSYSNVTVEVLLLLEYLRANVALEAHVIHRLLILRNKLLELHMILKKGLSLPKNLGKTLFVFEKSHTINFHAGDVDSSETKCQLTVERASPAFIRETFEKIRTFF